ncbi:MAG: hypothetical protein RL630_169 [Verrucomicrobiota bacterium]|jgi:hypothetical protein
MIKTLRAILILLLASKLSFASDAPDLEASPWLKPRSMENFKSLLSRSPFSLPTAEESTAAPDRFSLTGVATINEKPVVFVFDKNTQNRLMLEQLEGNENSSRDRLVELFQNADPKNLRATVQIEGQRTEIRFSETAFSAPTGEPMPPQAAVPGQHMPPQPPLPPQQVTGQQSAVQPSNNSGTPPPRRVIRRRVISGQAPVAQPVPGP